jgi:catechol 2,3-dioxygenase-like lactoylglutathione lyase family enzyme
LITRLSAQLFVGDIQASCDFFTKKLGFAVAFIYGDPPFYGQVVRGEARLDLRSVWEPVFVGDVREREHLLSASMNVATGAELAQLFDEFAAAGVAFHQALKTEPWGARTFVVRDPDGNLLLFAGPA